MSCWSCLSLMRTILATDPAAALFTCNHPGCGELVSRDYSPQTQTVVSWYQGIIALKHIDCGWLVPRDCSLKHTDCGELIPRDYSPQTQTVVSWYQGITALKHIDCGWLVPRDYSPQTQRLWLAGTKGL